MGATLYYTREYKNQQRDYLPTMAPSDLLQKLEEVFGGSPIRIRKGDETVLLAMLAVDKSQADSYNRIIDELRHCDSISIQPVY